MALDAVRRALLIPGLEKERYWAAYKLKAFGAGFDEAGTAIVCRHDTLTGHAMRQTRNGQRAYVTSKTIFFVQKWNTFIAAI